MVEVHLVAWNEAEIIRFVLSHYRKFADRIIVYDNYSDDGTPDICRDMGAEVRQFGHKDILSDDDYLTVKNNCWKKSKADWVIVCDADELLWAGHDYTRMFLDNKRELGATIIKTIGFDVMSHDMPHASLLELQHGFRNENYSKTVCFNPLAVKEINFKYGCHVCKPVGDLVYSPQDLILMHYRNIGGPQRLVDRHAAYRPRMSQRNIQYGLGVHYLTPEMHPEGKTDEQRVKEWYDKYDGSVEFCRAGFM